MNYRWRIDRDFDYERRAQRGELFDGDSSAVGVEGPASLDHRLFLTQMFRMYCEHELIYQGVASAECSFEPLDDYGIPNYGCDTISYYNVHTGRWEPL